MLNLNKQSSDNPLYVAEQAFSHEHIVQHCLWKLVSETGLIYNEDLSEMESIILAKLVNRKYNSVTKALPVDSQKALSILNTAIDKLICRIKSLQVQGQKYHSLVNENRNLKSSLRGLIDVSEQADTKQLLPETMDRPIDQTGLSPRTVRLLKSNGIDTLEKLRCCSLLRLRTQQRIGVKTIHEIQTILYKYSIHPSTD